MEIAKKNGFMLIELMVVVMIIATFASFFIPKYRIAVLKAQSNQCLATRKAVERAQQVYMMEHDNNLADLDTLYSKGYIDKKPYCAGGGSFVWVSTSPLKLGCSLHDITTPIAEQSGAFYSSDFTDMSGLRIVKGRWYTKDGKLYNRDIYSGQIFISTSPLGDYSAKVNATLLQGKGYGIYYRASIDSMDRISGYCFQFDPGLGNKMVVRKVINGRETAPLASYQMPIGYPIYNSQHQIEINVVGQLSKVYVDGQKVLEFSDSSYSSGLTGFRNWSGYEYFDSIEINRIH